MNKNQLQQGSILYKVGQPLKNLSLISKGSVSITTPYGKISLKEGDCIGILDISSTTYLYEYTATTNVLLLDYPIVDQSSLPTLFDNDSQLSLTLAVSITNQINQLIEYYTYLTFGVDNLYYYIMDNLQKFNDTCKKHSIEIQPIPLLEEVFLFTESELHNKWLIDYYESILNFSSFEQQLIFKKYPIFCLGYIMKASLDTSIIMDNCKNCTIHTMNFQSFLFSSTNLDLFELWTSLHKECVKKKIEDSDLESNINNFIYYLNGISTIDKALFITKLEAYRTSLQPLVEPLSEDPLLESNTSEHIIFDTMSLTNSLEFILNYIDYTNETITAAKSLVIEFTQAKDPLSNEDDMIALRKELTILFYDTYTKVFLKSLNETSIPSVIKMFLYFGYMDENLAGEENALYLQEVSNSISTQSNQGIYTFYEWLLAIYKGDKEPSRNEFDMDYTAHLLDLKTKGRITDSERSLLLHDNAKKVMFELKNMFPLVNKITVGRITGYCPILSKQNIIKDLSNTYVTATTVKEAFAQILSYDHTAYHREIVYSNPSLQVDREYIQLQVMPDVILLPSLGTRGVMWQEIEGRKRTTPGRMLVPIISTTDMTLLLMQLTGEFRWEMCKRIQGSRWNDISTPSLTSDYCDYAQFYRKNKNISSEAKAKIKNSLTQAKNNFKIAFVQDYMIWVQHEGNGSPRLNKVVRNILFLYCPFTLPIRDKLTTHPLYNEALNQYTLTQKRKLHHFGLLEKKLKALGLELPEEIQEEITLINN